MLAVLLNRHNFTDNLFYTSRSLFNQMVMLCVTFLDGVSLTEIFPLLPKAGVEGWVNSAQVGHITKCTKTGVGKAAYPKPTHKHISNIM